MTEKEMSAGERQRLTDSVLSAHRVVGYCRARAVRMREDLTKAEHDLATAEEFERTARAAAEAASAPRAV